MTRRGGRTEIGRALRGLARLGAMALVAASLPAARAWPEAPVSFDWGKGAGRLAAPAQAAREPAAPATASARNPAPPGGGTRGATATYQLDEVLRMPDGKVLQGIDGRPIRAGEVKQRYAQQLRSRTAASPHASQVQHLLRSPASRPVLVGGVTKAPGAALKVADEALLAEVRALDGAPVEGPAGTMQVDRGAVVKPPPSLPPPAGALAAQGRLASRSVGVAAGRATVPRAEPVTSAPSHLPCSKRQLAFTSSAERYLSSVNRLARDFWIDLDAGERTLVLSGCFGPGGAPREPPPGGEVRIEGSFPRGYVNARVRVWEETMIVAEVPLLTGVPDQDVAVRVVLGSRGATNERKGHLWAKRESRVLDDLSAYATSGDCKAVSAGPAWEVGDYTDLVAGTRGKPLGVGDLVYASTCRGSHPGVKGRMRFETHLAPGWQAVDLNLDVRRGQARLEWEGAGDFVARWAGEPLVVEDYVLGILTGRTTVYAFHFLVGQVRLEGPAGTAPFARSGTP
jgi:hypothetical protein